MKVVPDFSSFLGMENIFLKEKKDSHTSDTFKNNVTNTRHFLFKTVGTFEFRTTNSLFFRQNFQDFNRSYLEINLTLNTKKLTGLEDVHLLFNKFHRCINNYTNY